MIFRLKSRKCICVKFVPVEESLKSQFFEKICKRLCQHHWVNRIFSFMDITCFPQTLQKHNNKQIKTTTTTITTTQQQQQQQQHNNTTTSSSTTTTTTTIIYLYASPSSCYSFIDTLYGLKCL